jgi:phospholipase C
MKYFAALLFAFCVASPAYGQITKFTHIIVVVQENRTPDNLFQGLCKPPYGTATSCSTTPSATQYDIQTNNWVDGSSTVTPGIVALAGPYDLDHSHTGWVNMCDLAAGACKMDGAAKVHCGPSSCPSKPQFRFVDNSKGIVNPYLDLATSYGWANYMFQTNQGPSFPAHQFLFGGTSAPSALDDSKGIFASENMSNTGIGGLKAVAGCTATNGSGGTPSTTVKTIHPPGVESTSIYPCFEHETMADLFPPSVTWRYYAPNAGSIWTAPNAIDHICFPTGPGGNCVGPDWTKNVDLTPADVLQDIINCNLRSVSWVIPTGQNSDHAHDTDGGGPSWVAAIVNAIGNNTTCDTKGYWENTVIFITWDDWGGWYDHVPPTILSGVQGDYQYGFRVPLIVVSGYTAKGAINNTRHDFGSILRFIEFNFGIEQGSLNFADERSATNLSGFFDLSKAPRTFTPIPAPLTAKFFLEDKRPALDPDEE